MRTTSAGTTFFALIVLMMGSSTFSYGQTAAVKSLPVPKPQPRAEVNTQTLPAQAVKKVEKADEANLSGFGLAMSVTYSQSAYDYKDGTITKTNDYEFIPAYKWRGNVTALLIPYSQDLRFTENNDLGDLTLVQKLRPIDFSRIQVVPSLSAIVPESRESRERFNLEGAIVAKLQASIQKRLLIPGFEFSTGLSLGRNFHRYDTSLDGKPNSEYSSRQSISTGFEFGIFSVGGEFHHINRWTYAGVMKESFEHAEEFSIALGDHFGFTLGHTNTGTMLKPNGQDTNLLLVDENHSLVYAKLSMQY